MTSDTLKTFFTYLTALVVIMGGFAIIYLTRTDLAASEIRLLIAGFIGSALTFLFSARVADQASANATPSTTYVNAPPPSTVNIEGDVVNDTPAGPVSG